MVVQRTPDNVEFRLYLPHANVVEVVGDFTRWQESAVPMERVEDGWWSARVRIPRGEHRFSYLVDGRYWMPDYAANGIEHNQDGQWVSRLDICADAGAAEDASAQPREVRAPAAAVPTPGRTAAPAVRAMSQALGDWLGSGVGVRAAAQ